jgi:O-6-methylguanine DNA methyltransferase
MQKNDFKNRVLKVVAEIPKGKVLSYGQVAMAAGNPRAARVVGNIMKKNSDKLIPCHRVILSSGKIGGYNGLAGRKEKLLKQEGYKGKI